MRVRDLTAKDVMSGGVLFVRDDMTVGELAAFLAEHAISGAPVLDGDGHMVGVVSLMDIAENEGQRQVAIADRGRPEFYLRGWEDKLNPEEVRRLQIEDDELLVREIMTPIVYTVSEDTPLPKVARTMLDGRVHRLVVTRGERVVGIVTTMDLLKLLCPEG